MIIKTNNKISFTPILIIIVLFIYFLYNFYHKNLNFIKRDEKDRVTIYSGTELGYTLGTPIGMMVCNNDQRPNDYSNAIIYPRPSHADYTYLEKYTLKATSGGGRASARETIGNFFFFLN